MLRTMFGNEDVLITGAENLMIFGLLLVERF